MKCSQAAEKNQPLTPPAAWVNLQHAEAGGRPHCVCTAPSISVKRAPEGNQTNSCKKSGCLCVRPVRE